MEILEEILLKLINFYTYFKAVTKMSGFWITGLTSQRGQRILYLNMAKIFSSNTSFKYINCNIFLLHN